MSIYENKTFESALCNGEPAMPTQGVVTKNSFGNRSVDKGITQPTNNRFWVVDYGYV